MAPPTSPASVRPQTHLGLRPPASLKDRRPGRVLSSQEPFPFAVLVFTLVPGIDLANIDQAAGSPNTIFPWQEDVRAEDPAWLSDKAL